MLTNGSKHSTGVLHAGVAAAGQKGKTRNSHQLKAKKEDAALLNPIGNVARRDREEASTDVRRYAHQLGVVGRVTHILDDGW